MRISLRMPLRKLSKKASSGSREDFHTRENSFREILRKRYLKVDKSG